MRGCETSTTADESSGRLRLRPRDVYTATCIVRILSRESSLRACVYRCSTTANASTDAERLMLGSGTTRAAGTVGSAGGLQL